MRLRYGELFAGVSGMGQGFDVAGMVCRWRVEIDRAAAGVLAHHDPETILEADVVAFAKWLSRLKKNEPARFKRYLVHVLGGGSPCQDLSVAGLRKGLDGERSGLFRVMVRICRILQVRYVVWENVLGALSSNEGRDFACVIGAFTGCVPDVPDDGWGYGGFARSTAPGRWNVAWRVFDSQYFGVPQRRYRVFLVGSLGDGSCIEVLFEPESVCGNPPPRRETGQRAAGTLEASAGGISGKEGRGVVSGTLSAAHHVRADDAWKGNLVTGDGPVGAVTSKWAKGSGGPAGDECQNLVAHTLRARESGAQPELADACHPAGEIAPTMRVNGDAHSGFRDADGLVAPVAFGWQNSSSQGASVGEVSPSLDKSKTPASASGVRRLTPRECERLQGWPDDHTRWRRNLRRVGNRWVIVGKESVEQADGPRYRQCGNGITRNVAEWIGKRIVHFAANKPRRPAA